MVENFKHSFRLVVWKCMIERRDKIEYHHCGSEDAGTNNLSRTIRNGSDNEPGSNRHGTQKSYAMTDAVRDLFAERLILLQFE